MTDYTRKELAAINAAWRDLAYLADCTSWSNPPRLADALRYETRERGASVAKVLMVRDALQGITAPLSAADLFMLSPGIWHRAHVRRLARRTLDRASRWALFQFQNHGRRGDRRA